MDAETCKKKRATLRGLTTKMMTKIEAQLNSDDTKEEKIENLDDCLEQLKEKTEELKNLDKTIELTLKSDDIENEIIQSEEYQEKIIVSRRKIERFLKKYAATTTDIPMSHHEMTPSTTPTLETAGQLKLPTLQIQKFNGNTHQWTDFWNQFEITIDKNEQLTVI